MDRPKEDRRVRRTRRLLKQALAELMAAKDFREITVKDITERADLNRGTFYLHYTDTYNLLEKLENETLEDFQNMIDLYVPQTDQKDLTPILQPIAEYIRENAAVCKALFGNRASNEFALKFHRLIRDNGRKIIRQKYPEAEGPALDYFFAFITFGLTGVIKQWFNTNMQLDNEEIIQISNRIVIAAADSMLIQ